MPIVENARQRERERERARRPYSERNVDLVQITGGPSAGVIGLSKSPDVKNLK